MNSLKILINDDNKNLLLVESEHLVESGHLNPILVVFANGRFDYNTKLRCLSFIVRTYRIDNYTKPARALTLLDVLINKVITSFSRATLYILHSQLSSVILGVLVFIGKKWDKFLYAYRAVSN